MFIRVHDDVKITTEHKDLIFKKGKRKVIPLKNSGSRLTKQ